MQYTRASDSQMRVADRHGARVPGCQGVRVPGWPGWPGARVARVARVALVARVARVALVALVARVALVVLVALVKGGLRGHAMGRSSQLDDFAFDFSGQGGQGGQGGLGGLGEGSVVRGRDGALVATRRLCVRFQNE